MENREIEELLRESWQPEPPEGMRERVMNRARRELHRRTFLFPWPALPRWQAGFAVAGLAVFIACGVSNMARENRLAALENREVRQTRILVAQRPLALSEGRVRLYRLLEDPSSDLIVP